MTSDAGQPIRSPDSIRLTVLGSGDAFNAAGRFHSCYLLEGPGVGPIAVDFGATAMAALRCAGRGPLEVKGLAITHLHGDHVGGTPFLVIDGMYHERRSAPLEILGPKGSEQRLAEVLRAAYGDLANEKRPYTTHIRELLPGEEKTLCGVDVKGYPALHMDPPEVPLCLRMNVLGKTIAFSGDTAMCDALFEAARGVDLLVAECSGLAQPWGRHCTWEEWCENWDRLDAKQILFTHLGAAVRERIPQLLSEVPEALSVSFADDGMVLELR